MFGVLLDVSGSMQSAYSLDTQHDASVERTHAIFTSVANIVKQEVSRHERKESIFVSAFGLDQQPATCDLLSLLADITAPPPPPPTYGQPGSGHENLVALARENGTGYAESWIRQYLDEYDARVLYDTLKDDKPLTREMMNLLPRRTTNYAVRGLSFMSRGYLVDEKSKVHDSDAYKRAKQIIRDVLSRPSPKRSIGLQEHPRPRPVKEVSEMFDKLLKSHDPSSGSASLHNEIQKLIDGIKPYIYGGTPMCKALTDAERVFGQTNAVWRFTRKRLAETTTSPKVLFLLSDGESGDGDPREIAERLRNSDVTIITCFLTPEAIANPRCLFDPDHRFGYPEGKQALFEMSSIMDNTHAPVSYLVDAGWELPTCGESRLFVQANSLDVVNEFCETVVSQMTKDCDALVHLLEKVPLATYINQHNAEFEAKLQEGVTCYANAVAAVFHLAMSRIVGRDGGVPDFYEIRKRIIDEYGVEKADTLKVLANVCPEYRLQSREVDETRARQAINERRPVVAIYWLYNGEQWEKFSRFYRRTPAGILNKSDVAVSTPTTRGGHAVVLMRCNRSCLTFMNSWGTTFADKGFFRVKDQKVLNDTRFFDVYWNIEDLKPCEIEAYERACTERAKEIAQKFPSIKDLSHICPRCSRGSKVREFFGHILEVECPRCHHKFKPTNKALVQSLEYHRR